MPTKLLVIITLICFNCSQKGIVHLKEVDHANAYFILKMEKVNLYFLKSDVLKIAADNSDSFNNVMSRDAFTAILDSVQSFKRDTTSFTITMNDRGGGYYKNAHFLLSIAYYELLRSNRFQVFNKLSNSFEPVIFIKIVKTFHGSRKVYTLSNGDEFFSEILSSYD